MWKIVSLAGKFHPVMVHFPIVLLLLAALAEVLSIMGIRGFSREAAYFILDLSVIATVITVCLGWAAGAFAEFSEPLNTTMWIHRWLGTGTGILVIISWIASRINRKNSSPTALIVYRTMLLLSASLVVFTGHFGAMLVFGWNHFSV
ncbi:MAG: hypothetical protein GC154_20545 [bacterium]|nr:hypothetical protein [bacterium]